MTEYNTTIKNSDGISFSHKIRFFKNLMSRPFLRDVFNYCISACCACFQYITCLLPNIDLQLHVKKKDMAEFSEKLDGNDRK